MMKSQGGTLPEIRTRKKGSVVLPRTLIKTTARYRTVGFLHVLRTSGKNEGIKGRVPEES